MIDIKFVEKGLEIGTRIGRIDLPIMIGVSSREPPCTRVGIAGWSAKRLSRWCDEYLAPRWAEFVSCGLRNWLGIKRDGHGGGGGNANSQLIRTAILPIRGYALDTGC